MNDKTYEIKSLEGLDGLKSVFSPRLFAEVAEKFRDAWVKSAHKISVVEVQALVEAAGMEFFHEEKIAFGFDMGTLKSLNPIALFMGSPFEVAKAKKAMIRMEIEHDDDFKFVPVVWVVQNIWGDIKITPRIGEGKAIELDTQFRPPASATFCPHRQDDEIVEANELGFELALKSELPDLAVAKARALLQKYGAESTVMPLFELIDLEDQVNTMKEAIQGLLQ